MSEPKKWTSLAAIGDAITGLATRLRTRIDPPGPPAQPAASSTPEPGSATNATNATNAPTLATAHKAGVENGRPKNPL